MGVSVMLVESTNWLGGQLTAQGVCTPDEDGLDGQAVVDMYGSTASYRDLKHRIRMWYRSNVTLSPTGQAQTLLNVGRCWVNTGFAVEPSVAMLVLGGMLSEAGVIPVLGATVTGPPLTDRKIGTVLISHSDGTTTSVNATYILDATETGELLPAFGLNYAIGAEAVNDTNEPDAPPERHPEWVQPITYPIALIHRRAGENYVISKPDNYEQIKAQQNFTLRDGAIVGMFTGGLPFWTYRRVIDHTLFADGRYSYDVATINVGANDYKGGIYPDDSNPGNNLTVLNAAREASIAFLYWLQTEAPRDDGSAALGWPELMPATQFFNTGDALSPAPYIRESRRIVGIGRVVQQDIDADHNPDMRARLFPDSCGIGNYAMDVHAGANGGPELQKTTKPYQIPLSALVPRDCDNLIAAGKCLSVTHITNGAYRLHPQEWNVGEAAGILAAYCVHTGTLPSQAVTVDSTLIQVQNQLMNRGIPLFWWSDVLGNPFWKHIQMVGVRGIFSGDSNSHAFRPNDPLEEAEKPQLEAALGQPINWPAQAVTRAVAAGLIANKMGWIA